MGNSVNDIETGEGAWPQTVTIYGTGDHLLDEGATSVPYTARFSTSRITSGDCQSQRVVYGLGWVDGCKIEELKEGRKEG